MTTGARRLDQAAVVVAVLAGGASFLPAFPPVPLLLTVAAATLVPAALELLSGRAGRVLLAVVSVGALFVLLHGAVLDLLGMTLPAPATPGLLAVPAALCWLATGLGLELTRQVSGLAGLLPALPIWIVSGLLAPFGGFTPWPAVLVIVCLAAQLARQFSGAGTWQAAGTLVVVAIIVGVAVPRLAAHPVRRKVDPRTLIAAVALPPSAAGPIDWVDVWLTNPDQTLFRTATDAPVRYWRWAVLPTYDGVQWRPPGKYARAGLGVPPVRPRNGTIRQSVTIDHLPGPFLPAVDRPVRLADPVSGVDVDTATLITTRTVNAGFAFEVFSRPEQRSADVPCGAAGTPDVPPELIEPLTALVGTGCTGTLAAFATDVQRRLASGRTNVAEVPAAGTNIGVLRDFLARKRPGTVVEFDTAYALALRAAGIPARVVIGFQPADRGRVKGRDLRLWVEARIAGHGWITLHPTFPKARKLPAPQLSSVVQPPVPSPPPPSPSPSPTSAGPTLPPESIGVLPLATVMAAAAIGYLLLVLLVPVLRRTLRRRHGRPPDRAAAAWHDILDELTFTVGTERLRAATPASTRQLVRTAAGDMATIARAAEDGLFAPDPPDEDEIHEAWLAATRVRRRLRRRTDRRRRILRTLSWRNLRLRSPW